MILYGQTQHPIKSIVNKKMPLQQGFTGCEMRVP